MQEGVMQARAGAALLMFVVLGARGASAQEPGAAAVQAAADAVAKVTAAAAKPTPNTQALGEAFLDLANAGSPGAPNRRGLSVDAAAQPFLNGIEPRLNALAEQILDRRHRFVTGEDRPKVESRVERVTASFDVRSLGGTWRGRADQKRGFNFEEKLPSPVGSTPTAAARPIHFDEALLRSAIAAELGDEGGSVEADEGTIFVHATEDAVARAQALIDRFRAAIGPRLSVELSCWRLTRDAWLESRAGDEADKVLERALASGKAQLVSARDAVMEDGASASLGPTSVQALLSEEEINQTGVIPVLNQVVSKLPLGVHGRVRATLGPGRKDVILDVDVALREPISVSKETVHGDEIELPETRVTRCGTTLTVPLERTVLVGGTLSGIQALSSSCVFAVKATLLAQPAVAVKEVPVRAAAARQLPASGRAEVQELDQLLALVDDALAKVHAARRLEWGIFDVRDVIEESHERVAPRLGLAPLREYPERNMAGATLTFGDDRAGLPPQRLEQFLKRETGGDIAWASPASYEVAPGMMIVHQTPGTLAGVVKLVENLRKDRAGNVEVALDWCRVEDGLLSEVKKGVVLSKDRLEKLEGALKDGERAERTTTAFVVVERGDVGVVVGGTETTYHAGFEHSSGGTGQEIATVGLPILGVLRQGLALEALGHGDRSGGEGALVLDARVGLARATGTDTAKTPEGPITTPTVDDSETSFEGLVPEGAIALLANRVAGEKRPALLGVLRARAAR
jgi:hypothetical protein